MRRKNFLVMILFFLLIAMLYVTFLHYPRQRFIFLNREIFPWVENQHTNTPNPTSSFGKISFYVRGYSPLSNQFYMRLRPLLLVDKEYTDITIYSVVMLYQNEQYVLLQEPTKFKILDWNAQDIETRYKTSDGSWYTWLAYWDKNQALQFKNKEGLDYRNFSMVSVFNPMKIFKNHKVGDVFSISLQVSFQLEEGKIETHTSYFDIRVDRGWHSGF